MTNRREFLQIGMTATAWPIASRAARATGVNVSEPATLPLYKVIYDQRFDESKEFARRAQSLGLSVHAIEGDMTRFWYDDLYHQWERSPMAIAGLTAHGPLFCFEQLARDQGLRVVFRAEHKLLAHGVEHEFSGPLTMLRHSLEIENHAPHWAACMASVVADCPSGRAEISQSHARTETPSAVVDPDVESLFSWVIAPAMKA